MKKMLGFFSVLLVTTTISCGGFLAIQSAPYDDVSTCPAADDGFTGGCLTLPEDWSQGKRSKRFIQLFYQWRGQQDPRKETIVVVNGGPGSSLHGYASDPAVLALAKNHNLLFYDQRGVGRSAAVTAENRQGLDLGLYLTDSNVLDLAELVRQVVGRRAVILGHSYGAHVAFAFGGQHPELVSRLIALNGTTDEMGMVLQSLKKQEAFTLSLSQLDEPQLTAFLQVAQRGEAVNSQGQPIAFTDLMMGLTLKISSYAGQSVEVAAAVRKLIKANKKAIAAQLEVNAAKEGVAKSRSAEPLVRVEALPEEGFNPFMNPYIVCHEFINEKSIQGYAENVQAFSKQYIQNACGPVLEEEKVRVFDVKSQLGAIDFPVLIVGGTHDPLVPLETQQRDHKLLTGLSKNVQFVTFENTGHQIFSEAPKCFDLAMTSFLSAQKVKTGQRWCVESAAQLTRQPVVVEPSQ